MSDRFAGLYLHVPFCARVCPYCDFAVRTGDADRRRRFVGHLLQEIELYADWPLQFDTIYFGGGTPSLLDPADLGRILAAIRIHLRLAGDVRIFLEANPDDVTPARLREWLELGVHTLSLGVQSLDAEALDFLGRRHGPVEARRAVEAARLAGFPVVSIDLIYGLPGQTAESWQRELERGLALGPHHMSCYQLTIHQGTRFGLLEKRGTLTQLPLEEQADLFRVTHRYLGEAGMAGYEVSQFCLRPQYRSRHNQKYWNHTPYLGLGPSAHSFHEGVRWWNIRRADPWQERLGQGERPVEESETLDTMALVLESLMTGLRTYAGVDLGTIRERWGVDLLEANRNRLQRLEDRGLLAVDGERVVPTLDGLAVADTLAVQFDLSDRSG